MFWGMPVWGYEFTHVLMRFRQFLVFNVSVALACNTAF